MRRREIATPSMIQDVDSMARRQAIEPACAEEYGPELVCDMRVAHFNPAIIEVTVVVQARRPAMDILALELTEGLRRQGLRVAIRIAPHDEEPIQTMINDE